MVCVWPWSQFSPSAGTGIPGWLPTPFFLSNSQPCELRKLLIHPTGALKSYPLPVNFLMSWFSCGWVIRYLGLYLNYLRFPQVAELHFLGYIWRLNMILVFSFLHLWNSSSYSNVWKKHIRLGEKDSSVLWCLFLWCLLIPDYLWKQDLIQRKNSCAFLHFGLFFCLYRRNNLWTWKERIFLSLDVK